MFPNKLSELSGLAGESLQWAASEFHERLFSKSWGAVSILAITQSGVVVRVDTKSECILRPEPNQSDYDFRSIVENRHANAAKILNDSGVDGEVSFRISLRQDRTLREAVIVVSLRHERPAPAKLFSRKS